MKKILLVASLLLISINAKENLPVMVGGEVERDACSAYGKVYGLKKDEDGFLAVRKGPSLKYRVIDKLHNGDYVWECDQKGKWIGIVYGEDCNVSSPIKKRQPYKGTCKSGWVFGKWIMLVAG